MLNSKTSPVLFCCLIIVTIVVALPNKLQASEHFASTNDYTTNERLLASASEAALGELDHQPSGVIGRMPMLMSTWDYSTEPKLERQQMIGSGSSSSSGGSGSGSGSGSGNRLNSANRIRMALRRFLGSPMMSGNGSGGSGSGGSGPTQRLLAQADNGPLELEARIQTRSLIAPATHRALEAPQASKLSQEVSNSWYDSGALDKLDGGLVVQTRSSLTKPDDNDSLDGASGSSSSQQTGDSAGSSGHKTIRNVQPVFMRLPPRFGKRSSYLYK